MTSVNLLGKDFTKLYFNDLVTVTIFVSGIFCLLIGRWLNRENVIQVDGDSTGLGRTILGDHHMLWGIPLHYWSWIYFTAAIVALVVSHT